MSYDPDHAPPSLTVTLPRNGLPVLPPYVYQGDGTDQLAGAYDDPLLNIPDPDDIGFEWYRERYAEAEDDRRG